MTGSHYEILNYRDENNHVVLSMPFQVADDTDLKHAIKRAVSAYMQTPKGRKELQELFGENPGVYTYSHFWQSDIPDELCVKHGFRKEPDIIIKDVYEDDAVYDVTPKENTDNNQKGKTL